MRRASISNLVGRFGNIRASGVWSLYDAWKLDGLIIDARIATPDDISAIAARGRAGLLVDPSWPEVPDDGPGCADWMLARLDDLGFTGAHRADPCDVVFDAETHNMSDVLAMFKRFRSSRGWRQLFWSPEPFQGGGFIPELVTFINTDVNLTVLAECYQHPAGLPDMQPCAPDAVRADLTRHGIRDDRAKLYYQTFYETGPAGAATVSLPPLYGQDGCYFDLDHAFAFTAR